MHKYTIQRIYFTQLFISVIIHIQIVLLNYITWMPLSQLYLDPVIREYNYLTKVHKECTESGKNSSKCIVSCNERVRK